MLSLLVRLIAQLHRLLSDRASLLIEIAALRQQLSIYQRAERRPELYSGRPTVLGLALSPLATLVLGAGRRPTGDGNPLTSPSLEALLDLEEQAPFAGRPRIAPAVQALIFEMARDNPPWGAQRTRGELLGLGIEVGRETVRRYMLWGPIFHPHLSAEPADCLKQLSAPGGCVFNHRGGSLRLTNTC